MLILASASPRRRELMELITDKFRVITSEADETVKGRLSPKKVVEELALRKAKAVAAHYPDDVVVGADTIVALGGKILGKPKNADDAAGMLHSLSGRSHRVLTGVAVLSPQGSRVFSEETTVRFATLSETQIAAYIATGEPFDKAGGYGIQGKGALFIPGIEGDYYNVMGLPVHRLACVLQELHIGVR